MRRLSALVFAVGLAACDNPFFASAAEDELEEARRTWSRQRISSYAFTVRQDCFCAEDTRGPFRIAVASGAVVSVTDPVTGAPRAASRFVPLTVEDLFDRVQQAIDEGIDELDVRYDPALGYPRSIEIDLSRQALDAGIVIEASSLETGR